MQLSLTEIEELARAALISAGTSEEVAQAVAQSVSKADRDGAHRFGLASLPARIEQLEAGRIKGDVIPSVLKTGPSSILVDAKDGFTEPAIAAGIEALAAQATETGVSALAIANGWNPGVLGHWAEVLALKGFVVMASANTPRTVAPAHGSRALFGDNPVAFAVPRRAQAPLVIDQALSLMTRQDVFEAASNGKSLPDGIGKDQAGLSTQDPVAVLQGGSVRSVGGNDPSAHKATNLMIMFELLAGALSGANLSFLANGYEAEKGPLPRTGLFFLVLDPEYFAGADFTYRVAELSGELVNEPNGRLPGADRLAQRAQALGNGVEVDDELVEMLRAYLDHLPD